MTSEQYRQVETTVATREDAERLAAVVVEKRLAACAQIAGPIRSLYRWDGELQSDEEHTVRFKTRAALTDRLQAEIAALHAYDVPEILVLPVEGGSAAYLEWVSEQTRPD